MAFLRIHSSRYVAGTNHPVYCVQCTIHTDVKLSNSKQLERCVHCRLPRDIDSRATITIGSESFDVEATDLESIEIMGRGAYGVVERMRHRPSDTVMAVKVDLQYLDIS